MRRSLAKFSESEASNHTPSLADFTTTTPELKFSVHTRVSRRSSNQTSRFNAERRSEADTSGLSARHLKSEICPFNSGSVNFAASSSVVAMADRFPMRNAFSTDNLTAI
jgi:hypothetical protein